MSEATVGPRAPSPAPLPRRPTRTASTPLASSASSTSASPVRDTASTFKPPAATRSAARVRRPGSSLPTVATTRVEPNRWPSWMACSSAWSARGLPSSPIRSRVNTAVPSSWKYRERFELPEPEGKHLAGHGQAPLERLVTIPGLELLGHHHIFGTPPPERYSPVLPNRPLEGIQGIGRQAPELGDRGHRTEMVPGSPARTRPITAAASVCSRL